MARVIHRIWAGGPMPDDYRRYGERWAELNPGWTVDLWTEEQIRDLEWINAEVIDDLYRRDEGRRSVELFVQLADVIDYELLWRHGGVYVNCDINPLRPLADMDALYGTAEKDWVAREDRRFAVNAAMGATGPGSPFYADVIERLAGRYFDDPTGPMNRTTGPWLLTDTVADHPQVVTLPPRAFNPVHWRSVPMGGTATEANLPADSIGVHHWGHRRDRRTNRIEKE